MSVTFRVREQLLLPFNFNKTVSVTFVADNMLHCSKHLVLKLIAEGKIDAYRLREGLTTPYRVNYESVLAYIDSIHKNAGLDKRF